MQPTIESKIPDSLRVEVRFLDFLILRRLSGKSDMRVLNVAEKSDAAKNIAAFLSRGTATRREGLSVYNKIYEFECEVFGQNCTMLMTSVSGHLLNYEFVNQYRSWKATDPVSLFDAPVEKSCIADCLNIKKTLEREIRTCTKLIIWTDCDREGENIGFEIIEVCKAIKPNIDIYRAKFSEITEQSVKRALRNLIGPNKHISSAVDVRSELDLRIGAAFTRFQTLFLKKAFPNALNENLISYGSCQFPTLGFVVERFKAVSEFIPETFWQVNVKHTLNDLSVDFHWKRNRLFHKLACEVLYDKCRESGVAVVENVESKPKTKWRPKPLDTVGLEKLASRKLRVNAKETLRVAEKLYTQGLISYPRTETNIFPKELNLAALVQCQTSDSQWGEFAQKVLTQGPNPFQGNKSDQAHPPIHPIKYTNSLTGNEKQIYELIVRSFLACLSKHAEGLETIVDVDIAGEKFSAKGLMITARNYLEVYPYEKWTDREIHIYQKGDAFKAEIWMAEGETSPPQLLTEADLIALMEKHGIGTDATHADHIETIKARLYVGLQNDKYFVPRTLGMGLVEGYNNMGYAMAKPELRAELEADLIRICENQRSPSEILRKYLEKYKKIYEGVERQMVSLAEAIETYIQIEATPVAAVDITEGVGETLGKCPSCSSPLLLKYKKNGGKFIGCFAYPKCRVALWLPSFVLDVCLTTDTCPTCDSNTRLLRFKFERGGCYLPPNYVGCIGGCDQNLLEILNFTESRGVRSVLATSAQSVPVTMPSGHNENNDSGFVSLNENSPLRSVSATFPPKCYCGVPTICLTVKKSGPNQGKDFYKCDAPRGSSGCDFFLWKNKITATKDNIRQTGGDLEEMRCYCAVPCRRVTATKEGPNKGRSFYACGRSFRDNEKCNFFNWVDDIENINVNEDVAVFAQRTAGGHVKRTLCSDGGLAQGRKRKCGVCGQEEFVFSGTGFPLSPDGVVVRNQSRYYRRMVPVVRGFREEQSLEVTTKEIVLRGSTKASVAAKELLSQLLETEHEFVRDHLLQLWKFSLLTSS